MTRARRAWLKGKVVSLVFDGLATQMVENHARRRFCWMVLFSLLFILFWFSFFFGDSLLGGGFSSWVS